MRTRTTAHERFPYFFHERSPIFSTGGPLFLCLEGEQPPPWKSLMLSYLIRRILQMIPTLAGVILLVFLLFTFFGDDPAEIIAGLGASNEQVDSIRR